MPALRRSAATHGMALLTMADMALSTPVVVYATLPKNQVPAARLPIVVLVAVALATCTIWARFAGEVP